MILRGLHMFYGGLQQNLHHQRVYSGVPGESRGDTPESKWIHLKVFGRVYHHHQKII